MTKPATASPSKTYSMSDLYTEAIRCMKEEVRKMKQAPLTQEENNKLEAIAKSVSHEVVKEMKI